MRRLALIIPLLLLLLSPVTAAAEPEDYLGELEEALPEELPFDATDPEALSRAVGFEAILLEIYSVLASEGEGLVGFLLTLLGIAAVYALADSVDVAVRPATSAAISAIGAVAVARRILPAVRAVGVAMSEVSDFFGRLIPIFTGITVAGGGVSTATVGAMGMSVSLAVIGEISGRVLTFAVSMLFVFGMLSDLGGVGEGLLRSVRSFFTRGVGIIAFLFGATLALQTALSAASDGVLVRTAKFAAASSIPVVGSTVGGAVGTLAAGLSYVKEIAGTASVAVIGWISLSPLVLLLAYRAALSLADGFAGIFNTGRGIKCFSSMLLALDSLIAIYSMSTIVYIFQIILFVKSGVAIL